MWNVRALFIAGALSSLWLLPVTAALSQSSGALPSDAAIRTLLVERIGAITGESSDIGIVVGVVDQGRRRIIAYGRGGPNVASLNTGTVFEIGSVTKAFTALLLADMVERNEVALDDPVAKYLPSRRIPMRRGRPISLLDLATHASGLPFMPETSLGQAHDTASLYRFLSSKQALDNATSWEYSNLGYWLLGETLASRSDAGYEKLLQARVLVPLGLDDTAFQLSGTMQARLATGHDAGLQTARAIATTPLYAAMSAAGLLYSTVDDLSTFAAAALGYTPSPLAPAFSLALRPYRPLSQAGLAQALAWTVIEAGGDKLLLHEGGTLGYESAVVLSPPRGVGVIVLSNYVGSVTDLARHLMQPGFPLAKQALAKRSEISLERKTLEAYAGRYTAPDEGTFELTLEGDFLSFQAPDDWGLPKLHLRAATSHELFATELPLRITVETDTDGRGKRLLIRPPRGNHVVPADRRLHGR